MNRFGEPNFRIIWGWTPTAYIYNRAEGCYDLRPRYIPKKRDRWVVEKWFPPENYGTPWMWRHQFTENIDGIEVDILGPFPSRGEYEQLITVETWHRPDCETPRETDCVCGGMAYMDLSPTVADELVRRAEASRDLNPWARKEHHKQIQDAEEKSFDDYADDAIKDCQPSFDLSPTVYLGHKNVLRGKYEGGNR